MGFLLFTALRQGRPSHWLHKCGSAQRRSGTPWDHVRMEPHTLDFLLLVALSLGLSRGDGFRCSDLNYWMGFQLMLSPGTSPLLWPTALAFRSQDDRKFFQTWLLSREWESLIIMDPKWYSIWCSWSFQLFLTDCSWFLVHESDIGSPSTRNRSLS